MFNSIKKKSSSCFTKEDENNFNFDKKKITKLENTRREKKICGVVFYLHNNFVCENTVSKIYGPISELAWGVQKYIFYIFFCLVFFSKIYNIFFGICVIPPSEPSIWMLLNFY